MSPGRVANPNRELCAPRVSVAARTLIHGVYDVEIVAILEGKRIIDAVNSYRPYIEWIRETLDRPTVYSDIYELADMMKVAVAKVGQPWRPVGK